MSVDFSDNPPVQRDHDEGGKGNGSGAEREALPSDRTVEHENVDVPLTLPQPDGAQPDSPASTDTAPASQPLAAQPPSTSPDVDSGADLALAGDQ